MAVIGTEKYKLGPRSMGRRAADRTAVTQFRELFLEIDKRL